MIGHDTHNRSNERNVWYINSYSSEKYTYFQSTNIMYVTTLNCIILSTFVFYFKNVYIDTKDKKKILFLKRILKRQRVCITRLSVWKAYIVKSIYKS